MISLVCWLLWVGEVVLQNTNAVADCQLLQSKEIKYSARSSLLICTYCFVVGEALLQRSRSIPSYCCVRFSDKGGCARRISGLLKLPGSKSYRECDLRGICYEVDRKVDSIRWGYFDLVTTQLLIVPLSNQGTTKVSNPSSISKRPQRKYYEVSSFTWRHQCTNVYSR